MIKDSAFTDYLIKANLSEYDMAKLVCHAPISLFEKQSLYNKLIEEKHGKRKNDDDRFSYENYLRIVTQAIGDLNLPKDGIFLLVEHSFYNGSDEQLGCAPFRNYRVVQDYLKETFSEGGEENNDRFTGGFYNEVMHDYVDLEYYRSDFNGGERV
ncbi:MAG: hypothetical protein MR844_00600, partial [Clostridia bacterium]|nr:hypothetical protein [Clostridia bacterium]